ncbi:MAG: hypothetical protein HY681_09155 [Chloroflexi bacterium]|nr:hypothetical protein [Chloroflexota bacterium]
MKVVGAGDYLLVDYTVEFDNATVPPTPLLSPTTAAPQVTTIPDSFASSAAGYDQTTPTIQGAQDLVTKVNQALRKAESWGWSKSLSNIKRISVGKPQAKIWMALVRPWQAVAVSPPELFSGEPGVVFLDEKLVTDYDPASSNEYWLLPRLLVHESLHHAYYTAGYTIAVHTGPVIGDMLAFIPDFPFQPTMTVPT